MFKQFFEDKKGVIFDLDGTLVDTLPIWNKAFEDVFSELGYEWKGKHFIGGKHISEVWSDYLDYVEINPDVSISELVKRTKDRFMQNLENSPVEVKDGFWSFSTVLREDKKFKLGLVTNTDKNAAEKIIERLGLKETFDVYLYGDDVKKKKPFPEIYKKAAKELGLKSKEILVFEDSPEGARAANGAGMDIIVVWDWRRAPKEDYPSSVKTYVPDFRDFALNLDKTYKESLFEPADEEEVNSEEV